MMKTNAKISVGILTAVISLPIYGRTAGALDKSAKNPDIESAFSSAIQMAQQTEKQLQEMHKDLVQRDGMEFYQQAPDKSEAEACQIRGVDRVLKVTNFDFIEYLKQKAAAGQLADVLKPLGVYKVRLVIPSKVSAIELTPVIRTDYEGAAIAEIKMGFAYEGSDFPIGKSATVEPNDLNKIIGEELADFEGIKKLEQIGYKNLSKLLVGDTGWAFSFLKASGYQLDLSAPDQLFFTKSNEGNASDLKPERIRIDLKILGTLKVLCDLGGYRLVDHSLYTDQADAPHGVITEEQFQAYYGNREIYSDLVGHGGEVDGVETGAEMADAVNFVQKNLGYHYDEAAKAWQK